MKLARLLAVLVTIAALVLTVTKLELSKDLTTLFPRTPEAAALARVTRAFGGGDVALVLVEGPTSEKAEAATTAAGEALRATSVVRSVMTSIPSRAAEDLGAQDPSEAWRFAGPVARDRLARAVTEDGMRARLRETRALLLAPGAPEMAELLARDPLRLALIPWEDKLDVAAGVRGAPGEGGFVAGEGKTRLVVVEPKGRAFEPGEAARFTTEAETALDAVRKAHPGVSLALTGGHVIARQTEAMIRSDLERSGALSVVLAAVVFVLTFGRKRALVAVLPPLAAGTLWTTALAALVYPRLSAVATAFAAVVVGVGVDTGVHVYGRLLRARRDGLDPRAAADVALRETWRPTLGAALAAGGAFACLAFSEIEGMRQLGILCGAGEVLTAVAILVVVPEIGRLLERGPPPRDSRFGASLASLTRTRGRAGIALGLVVVVLGGSLARGLPTIDHAVIALDQRTLPALATYERVYAAFGGSRGQLVVVSADANEARARARADAVAEAADRLVAGGAVLGYDALARLAPSPELQRARLLERDRLDLPGRRALLARVLAEEGFAEEAMAPALEAFAHPSVRVDDPLADDDPSLSWLRRRHLARDDAGVLAVTHVRIKAGRDELVRTTLRGAEPSSVMTGFSDLERGLVRSLGRDLPRVLAGAFVVVLLVLGVSLRRPSRIVAAVGILAVEIVIVVALAHALGVRWHVYDALILPILLGITLDEVLFLLEAAERIGIDRALEEQGPLGVATALTTAAGFGALVVCKFDGLVDVGKVGALGSTVGLLLSLVVIPALYRLLERGSQKQPL